MHEHSLNHKSRSSKVAATQQHLCQSTHTHASAIAPQYSHYSTHLAIAFTLSCVNAAKFAPSSYCDSHARLISTKPVTVSESAAEFTTTHSQLESSVHYSDAATFTQDWVGLAGRSRQGDCRGEEGGRVIMADGSRIPHFAIIGLRTRGSGPLSSSEKTKAKKQPVQDGIFNIPFKHFI